MNIEFSTKKLIDNYSSMIFHIALGYLRNKEDAEDLVQEVFINYIKYIKKNNKFTDENHEKYWIIRVTLNLCNNQLKTYKKKDKFYSNDETLQEFNFDEDEICLLDCISKLKSKYRDVFELFYIKEFKISEISKILNISESNVKTRLKRARESLKTILQSGGDNQSERFGKRN